MTTFPSALADRLAKTVASTQRAVTTAHQRLNTIGSQVSALQPAVANTQNTLIAVKTAVAGVTFTPPVAADGYGVGSTPQSPNGVGTSGDTGTGVDASWPNVNGVMNYNNTADNSDTLGGSTGPPTSYGDGGNTGWNGGSGVAGADTGAQTAGTAHTHPMAHYHSTSHEHTLGSDVHTHNMQHDHAYGQSATDINNLWNNHNALVGYYNTLRTCYSDTYVAVDDLATALNNLASQFNALVGDHANLTTTVTSLQTQITTTLPAAPP